MRSEGLTQRPPVTLPPAKRKLISAPDKDKCQRADTVQATTCTCLHASALYANQCLTMCIHSASTCLHLPALAYTCLHQVLTILQQRADTVQTILHATYTVVLLDNQSTYGKKCRVQTVLQKTVSVGFFTGIYTSAHPHICEHNAHHTHNPLRRQPICTPTHLRAQRAHTLS